LIIVEYYFLIRDGSPQSFDENVIKNTTASVTTDGNLGVFEPLCELFFRELTPLVRVKNLGLAKPEGFFQGRNAEEGVLRIRQFP